MQNPSSPLDTLRQLKEMLDAGALTPTEFEALKQRLVLNPEPTAPPPVAPAPDVPAVEPVVALPPVPAVEQHSPMFEDVADDDDEPFVPAALRPVPAASNVPIAPPLPAPAAFVPAPEPEPEPETPSVPGWTTDEFPESETAPSRSPLALILSIGGLLALLGLVLYLSLNRPPSEHISSTSQTAADSLANPIETGPQAEQLPSIEAMPETVRVAPAHPAPAIQPRPTTTAPDSAATAVPTATDSAAGQ